MYRIFKTVYWFNENGKVYLTFMKSVYKCILLISNIVILLFFFTLCQSSNLTLYIRVIFMFYIKLFPLLKAYNQIVISDY